MWLLIVEAFIALALLGFVVWWTMFHGRRKGEAPADPRAGNQSAKPMERTDSTDSADNVGDTKDRSS